MVALHIAPPHFPREHLLSLGVCCHLTSFLTHQVELMFSSSGTHSTSRVFCSIICSRGSWYYISYPIGYFRVYLQLWWTVPPAWQWLPTSKAYIFLLLCPRVFSNWQPTISGDNLRPVRKCIMGSSAYPPLTGLIMRFAALGSTQDLMELNVSCPHSNLLICDPRVTFQINYVHSCLCNRVCFGRIPN